MKIIIIGSGPAGLMASIKAAEINKDVLLLDSNDKVGKKIYITGKGRCNVTNLCSTDEFLDNIVNNKKFLYSAINNFSPYDTMDFFTNNGLKLKVERGNRVFPDSDKASDISKVLETTAKRNGVKILLGQKVLKVSKDCENFIVQTEKNKFACDRLIIATGGASYPATGSTGDGYSFAKAFGHTVIPAKPALVGIDLYIDDSCAGVSLKNVKLSIKNDKDIIFSDFGEMLFTHTGVSGPIVLSVSSFINRQDLSKLKLIIDLKPALDEDKLDIRLLRDFESNKNKNFENYVHELLPKGLIDSFLKRLSFASYKKINEITKAEREEIIALLKNFDFKIKRLCGIEQAVVTSGGVNTKEVSSSTMESKLVKGLFFAGEVLDVDALTGGFNIQIALATGYLAGENATKE